MTSEEIKKCDPVEQAITGDLLDVNWWLKEIAYQLAIMNERDELRTDQSGCLSVRTH